MAALERAGLLVLKETRQRRGAVEKWYAGVSQQIQGTQAVHTRGRGAGAAARARRAVAATVLEQAKQELLSVPRGAKEPALLARLVVTAPPGKIPAIRKHLYDTVQSMRTEWAPAEEDHASADDCERWALTLAFAPVRSPAPTKRGKRD